MNERTNEQTNEWTNERMNERTNERTIGTKILPKFSIIKCVWSAFDKITKYLFHKSGISAKRFWHLFLIGLEEYKFFIDILLLLQMENSLLMKWFLFFSEHLRPENVQMNPWHEFCLKLFQKTDVKRSTWSPHIDNLIIQTKYLKIAQEVCYQIWQYHIFNIKRNLAVG